MPRPPRTATLSDPRALRAFAHPVRQQLIHELVHGRVLTATEAAEFIDQSPSAISHHFQILEKYGLVERAAPSADGRERPWRATAQRINLDPVPGAAGSSAMGPVLEGLLEQFRTELHAYLEQRETDPWDGIYAGLSRAELWLTRDEVETLGRAIERAVEPYQHRHAKRHPDGSRRTGVTLSIIPLEPSPDAG